MLTFPSPMDPRETVPLYFDATDLLPSGVTLTGIVKTDVTPARGSDPNPGAIIQSSSIITSVETLIYNGKTITLNPGLAAVSIASKPVDATWYEIAHTCSTTDPNLEVVLKAVLQVTSQA